MEENNNCNFEKELEEKNLKIFFQKNGKEETLFDRYFAGSFLINKINKKFEALSKMAHAYQLMRNQVQLEAVENFKLKLKEEFVNTYYNTKGIIDIKMQKDFDRLKAVEEHSCYLINGIDVKLKDCKDCKKRCEYYSKTLKEFNFKEPEISTEVEYKINITKEEEDFLLNEVIDETELEETDREEVVIEFKE